MADLKIDIQPRRVANLLKRIVNTLCEENELWFDESEIGEEPTMFDMYRAIKILEETESESFRVVDDAEHTDCAWR